MAKNHEDEYSSHFLIEWDDGQSIQASYDHQYKADVPYCQVCAEYDDADIILEGISKNYA